MNNNTNIQKAIKWHYRLSTQRYLRLITRLCDMSIAEFHKRIALRIRSIGSVRSKYLQHYKEQSHEYGRRLASSYSDCPAVELSKQFDEIFFFGPSSRSELMPLLSQHCKTDIDKTITIAEELCQSGINLLGIKINPLVESYDWQADPVSGIRMWTDDWLDEAAAISVEKADVKYVWEVNRHQFLPVLGRAYWISGNEEYVENIVAVIDRWIASNPAGKGVNWCSHLEVSMRVVSWIWVMPIILSWDKVDQEFVQRWLYSIGQHYYHLKENLSEFTDPTNHLIGETLGLYMLCCCFPQIINSDNERSRTKRILEEELDKQNYNDGVNKEQASSYHRFVLDFYIQAILLARKRKEPLSDSSKQRIMAMCEFQSYLAGFSEWAPMIGDSDDARGIPFPENFGWNFVDISSVGALLFNQSEWLVDKNHIPGMAYWLLGPAGVDGLVDFNVDKNTHRMKIFSDGGYCFFRNNGLYGKADLIFDVGPLGMWPNASHAHADALSLNVSVNGSILLGDPGTGDYFGSQDIRNKFRKTSSHNTVTVDNLDQSDIYGTFKWVNPFSTVLEASDECCGFSYARARHSGYKRLINPVAHTRSILSVETFGWLVLDYLEGSGAHVLDWNFHSSPGVVVTRHNRIQHVWNPEKEAGLKIIFLNVMPDNNVQINMDNGGVWSTEYGECKSSPRINMQSKMDLPVFQLTLLMPITSDTDTLDAVEINKIGRDAYSFNLSFIEEEVFIQVNPENELITLSGVGKTNAEILYIQKDSSGIVKRACITGKDCYLHSEMLKLSSNNANISGYICQNS